MDSRARLVVALVVLLVAVSALVLLRRPTALAGDPAGAEACSALDRWLRGSPAEGDIEVSRRIAEVAQGSSTEAIRTLVKHGVADRIRSDGTCCDDEGFVSIDLHELRRACVAEGVDLPPY